MGWGLELHLLCIDEQWCGTVVQGGVHADVRTNLSPSLCRLSLSLSLLSLSLSLFLSLSLSSSLSKRSVGNQSSLSAVGKMKDNCVFFSTRTVFNCAVPGALHFSPNSSFSRFSELIPFHGM